MRKITVEPQQLDSCASKIEQENSEYQRTVHQLFEQVDTMKASWSGKDNVAFTNQIRGFEDDFKQISLLCQQYCEFLRNSARAYREMQDELANQAARLVQ